MNCFSNKRIGIIVVSVLLLNAALLLFIIWEGSRIIDTSIPLTDERIAEVLDANSYTSPEQRTVVESAVSLVGRVSYFWGGKYDDLGEDPDWGKPRTVTSEGSPSTGTVIPWGLDCSGYVTWAFIQAGYTASEIGHGTWNQWFASEEIALEDVVPGDLVFVSPYPGSSGNHVGIVIGYADDKPVAAHCSSAYNNVVVTYIEDNFNYARRPILRNNAD